MKFDEKLWYEDDTFDEEKYKSMVKDAIERGDREFIMDMVYWSVAFTTESGWTPLHELLKGSDFYIDKEIILEMAKEDADLPEYAKNDKEVIRTCGGIGRVIQLRL